MSISVYKFWSLWGSFVIIRMLVKRRRQTPPSVWTSWKPRQKYSSFGHWFAKLFNFSYPVLSTSPHSLYIILAYLPPYNSGIGREAVFMLIIARRVGLSRWQPCIVNLQYSYHLATMAAELDTPQPLAAATTTTTTPITKKLHGRAFYESIGSPKFIVAPMVNQSEFVSTSSLPQDRQTGRPWTNQTLR